MADRPAPLMNRLLITGAAGGLGRQMRDRLAHLATTLRLSDIVDPATGSGPARPNEELVHADLGNAAAVEGLVAGCDGIVHLGGISVERPFAPILNANIVGLFNLYEAARAHGQPRIVFASSNHTVGFHTQDECLGPDCTLRPDGLYGVSKAFGEALARMYFDKFGQETALVRIGSCFEKPDNHRMLSTWLSFRDFAALIEAVFRAPVLGCPVIWGASANTARWWDNSHLDWLGWAPKDNSEVFRAEIDAAGPKPGPDDPRSLYQGGMFTRDPIYRDG
jgi:uronate dehydrogenase